MSLRKLEIVIIALAFGFVQSGSLALGDTLGALAGAWPFSLDSPPGAGTNYDTVVHGTITWDNFKAKSGIVPGGGVTGGIVTTLPGGHHQVDSFFDVFFELSLTDLSPPVPGQGTAHAIFTDLPPALPGSSDFAGRLQLTADVPSLSMMLRESPTLPSLGTTTVTSQPGGAFHIDSFFDVFTELSIDGGQTWIPGDNSLRVSGSGDVAPEPSALALIVIGGSLLGWRACTRTDRKAARANS
jgi:hypothetical protein